MQPFVHVALEWASVTYDTASVRCALTPSVGSSSFANPVLGVGQGISPIKSGLRQL